MTELDLNQSQCESLLLVHSLARSLLLIIKHLGHFEKEELLPSFELDGNLILLSVEAGHMTMESVSYSLRQTVFGILKSSSFVRRRTTSILPTMLSRTWRLPSPTSGHYQSRR